MAQSCSITRLFLLSFIFSHAHTILLTSCIRPEILMSLKSENYPNKRETMHEFH